MRLLIKGLLFSAFVLGAAATYLESPLAPTTNLICWGCCLISLILEAKE